MSAPGGAGSRTTRDASRASRPLPSSDGLTGRPSRESEPAPSGFLCQVCWRNHATRMWKLTVCCDECARKQVSR